MEFRNLEKANLIAALRHTNWQVWGASGAAELLGIKPSTLTYRMKIFGIRKPDSSTAKTGGVRNGGRGGHR
jgi:transcriptional regulator with GAF, ATPase, and Fis domain